MSEPIRNALDHARSLGVDRLDAQQLLAHLLGRSRTWLLAHDEEILSADQAAAYRAIVRRRASGEPFAYLTGEREFHGLSLRVTPDVLIPRPDTETLVDWAIELLDTALAGVEPHVVDLGTGSGAIALAVKHARPAVEMTALDASAEALAVARDNGLRLGLDVCWRQSDWWQALSGQRFHLALSNPPYIAEGDPHLSALAHEPSSALTAGPSGLVDLRRVVAGAPEHLHPGGWLLLEHGHDQAEYVCEYMLSSGFKEVFTRKDLAGLERCSGGRLHQRG